jgi:hypothetical protein
MPLQFEEQSQEAFPEAIDKRKLLKPIKQNLPKLTFLSSFFFNLTRAKISN